MKFPVDKCWDCGLDLTTAEPAEVTYPGNEQALAKCPKCGKSYFMLEVTPEPVSEPVEVEPEPEPVVEPEAPAEEAPPAEPVEEVPPPEPEAGEAEPEPEE